MSAMGIFGRKKELKLLDVIWESKEAEFLAIYGRRRVGKTFLISRHYQKKKGVYFEITGQKNGSLTDQLENFSQSFGNTFLDGLAIQCPKNWKEAFSILTKQIDSSTKNGKKFVFFIDELPWLASKRSKLLQALDFYWNHYWSRNRHFILVVCGSAASWMLEHLINAKGGLYNRLTRTLLLKPFNLHEVKLFLEGNKAKLSYKQILDVYMVFGGVPHYLKQVVRGKSATEIINNVCFDKDGFLYSEFDRLFQSLFDKSEVHLELVEIIATKRYGVCRKELVDLSRLSSGGTLNKKLAELQSAGFIQAYIPYGRKKKDYYYKIIDEYCYFYLNWIKPLKDKGIEGGKSYWQLKSKTPMAISWAGYSFESICFKHIHQIQKALGLDTVGCELGNYRFLPKKGDIQTGAQIDLLFDREDGVITLCEIKYSDNKVAIDKDYAKKLMNKQVVFEKNHISSKQIFFALISTKGLKKTIWSEELIDSEVVLEDLFDF